MKKKVNQKRIVALGLAVTSVCGAPICTYSNVMAQDIVTNDNSEEVESLVASTESAVVQEQAEITSEVSEPIITEESTSSPEEVFVAAEVLPESDTTLNVIEQKTAEDDIAFAKETAMSFITDVENQIVYPSADITNRINALKEKVNTITDISEIDSFGAGSMEILELAEATIYACEISYDENYPYEYVDKEELNILNWALYDGNFAVKVVDACGNTVFPLCIIESASYSAAEDKIICQVYATGKSFVNDMDFVQTVKVPVKQVQNIGDKDSELVLAQDEAIRMLKAEVDSLTQDCAADLKNKVDELQNEYITRIKSAATSDEVMTILNEAINYLPGYIQNGGIGEEELKQYIENAVVELCKDAQNKRENLTDKGQNLFTEMLVKAEEKR